MAAKDDDKARALRRKQQDVYATMSIALDHVLGKLSAKGTLQPLPASVPLRAEERALPDAWSKLYEVVLKRKTMMETKKGNAERHKNKNKKDVGSSAEKSKASSSASNDANVASTVKKTAVSQSKKQDGRNTKTVLPLGGGSNSSSSRKLSPRELDCHSHSSPRNASVIDASSAKHSPRASATPLRVNAMKKEKQPQRAHPVAAPPVRATAEGGRPSQALIKLRELPHLCDLEMQTPKYNAILKWLNCDTGKNDPIPDELDEFVHVLSKTPAFASRRASSGKAKKASTSAAETLDDLLRMEKKQRFVERKRADLKRKRQERYNDDDEYEENGVDDDDDEEEAEYADGYSDSDEAELIPEIADPTSPSTRSRDITGGTKRYARQPPLSTQSATPTSPVSMTAKEQLAKVIAKIKEEDGETDSDAKYLAYTKSETSATETTSISSVQTAVGTSAQSAIILEDSDEEEEEEEEVEEEEEEEEEEETVVQQQPAAIQKAQKPAARLKQPAPAQDEEEEEEEEEDAEGSSTDDDQDLFDLNEEDVYVVESILEVKVGRRLNTNRGVTKELDLYLVKWDGYDELTWEPESNIPKRLIDMFRSREISKKTNRYQIHTFHERRVVKNLTTGRDDTIYHIHWLGQQDPIWECRTNLPEQVVIWLEKVSRAKPSGNLAGKKKAKR
ncbi:Chromodomain protein, partial [Globisporangium splendens]